MLWKHGCQIFLDTIYQNEGKYTNFNLITKWPYNIPNGHTIYLMAIQYTKWPYNIPNGHTYNRYKYQMAIQYIYHIAIQYIGIPNGHTIYKVAVIYFK
jgi:hypothetical protein